MPIELTKEEAQVYWVAHDKYRPGLEPGHFRKALIEAFLRADDENFARLALGFPLMAAAVQAWRHGDLSKRAEALGGRL